VTAATHSARKAARRLHRDHDENFPVAIALLPRAVHDDMRAIYAFCRHTDNLGDEGDPAVRSERLEAWAADLERAFEGRADDARLQALSVTVARKGLDPDLFRRLVEANRIDQRQNRWADFDDLLHYCEHSATPVGRMVLGVLGYTDEWRGRLSDATCIGLQLINFWQDIRRDLDDRGRIYLPADDMARFGVSEDDLRQPAASPAVRELVRFQVERAREQLVRGAPLAALVPRRAGLYLRMFTAGGLAICDAVAAQDYDTVTHRPAPGRLGRVRIVAQVLAHAARGAR
jgi:squalene synthase HpnC